MTVSKNIDNSNLDSLISTLSTENNCYIAVVSQSGDILSQSANKFNSLPQQRIEELISQMANGELIDCQSMQMNDRPPDMQFEGMPHLKDNQAESITYLKSAQDKVIVITSRISTVDATITTLRYQLYVVTGIMIILSVIVAVIIAKRFSKPIEKLNNSAKSLAKGNYDVVFDNKVYKEIGELSDTLNVAASELQKVEALRRELMANISHDLRTPLSLIYGYAEVMHDFPEDISPKQTQAIMDESRRLSTLVNDVLDISNLEAVTQKLNAQIFNLTKSLKMTTDRISELVSNDGFSISFEYDREISLNADEIKLTQAFYNLLINAINYTGEDKKVFVTQKCEGDRVKISVTDTGEGISQENLAYIWERYYKVDKTHKRPVTGTGLGLSIVKRIIELHGGEYGVESEQGKGSTFWFSLKI